MPKIDGFGVLAQLRRDARFINTPVVALTGNAMHGDGERVLLAGFSCYMAKPVDLAVLRSEMERLIGRGSTL